MAFAFVLTHDDLAFVTNYHPHIVRLRGHNGDLPLRDLLHLALMFQSRDLVVQESLVGDLICGRLDLGLSCSNLVSVFFYDMPIPSKYTATFVICVWGVLRYESGNFKIR